MVTKQQVDQKAAEIQATVEQHPELLSWTRLPAAQQRALFGAPVFGKKEIRALSTGIKTSKRVAYGLDYDLQSYSWQEIAYMLLMGLKAEGRRYKLPTE